MLRAVNESRKKQRVCEVFAKESVEEPEGLVGAARGTLSGSIIVDAGCAVHTLQFTRLFDNHESVSERERVCSRSCRRGRRLRRCLCNRSLLSEHAARCCGESVDSEEDWYVDQFSNAGAGW